MSEVKYDDAVIGPSLMTFDGRILELFTARDGSKSRMIVGMLHVQVKEPNRNGRRQVNFTALPGFRSGGGFGIFVAQEDWPRLKVFVDEVAAATN